MVSQKVKVENYLGESVKNFGGKYHILTRY